MVSPRTRPSCHADRRSPVGTGQGAGLLVAVRLRTGARGAVARARTPGGVLPHGGLPVVLVQAEARPGGNVSGSRSPSGNQYSRSATERTRVMVQSDIRTAGMGLLRSGDGGPRRAGDGHASLRPRSGGCLRVPYQDRGQVAGEGRHAQAHGYRAFYRHGSGGGQLDQHFACGGDGQAERDREPGRTADPGVPRGSR
jgi:hypothetical protein